MARKLFTNCVTNNQNRWKFLYFLFTLGCCPSLYNLFTKLRHKNVEDFSKKRVVGIIHIKRSVKKLLLFVIKFCWFPSKCLLLHCKFIIQMFNGETVTAKISLIHRNQKKSSLKSIKTIIVSSSLNFCSPITVFPHFLPSRFQLPFNVLNWIEKKEKRKNFTNQKKHTLWRNVAMWFKCLAQSSPPA